MAGRVGVEEGKMNKAAKGRRGAKHQGWTGVITAHPHFYMLIQHLIIW